VRALSGVIYDVAVDIRKGSATYGKWVGIELNSEAKNMVYVPEGFAHGFSVLSQTAEIEYFCTNIYAPDCEVGIAYNDPALNIDWKVKTPIVSARDHAHKPLSQTISEF
jgi:dTDP-4-dehydrorhamnose 3,5-epimerase